MAVLLGAVAVALIRLGARRPQGRVYVLDEVEALARVIRSEAGTSSPQQRLHVAWATRNLAAERGQTISRMACWPCGPQGAGRPVSTAQAPTEGDRRLARDVLSAAPRLDATGGATHFLNPVLQDELAAHGRPGYRGRPYRRVRRRWRREYGLEPYYRLGPDLELWGRRRVRRSRRVVKARSAAPTARSQRPAPARSAPSGRAPSPRPARAHRRRAGRRRRRPRARSFSAPRPPGRRA